MRIQRAILAAFLLTLALPTSSQSDREPYFSLSSHRTFAPGEKPTVQLLALNVDAVEFRVYRVNDPILFFQKLEDFHQFGGRAPRLPHEPTLLERFHGFKRNLRILVRDFFRAQFSPETRAKIRDFLAERQREPVLRVATYAQVPVLNEQQLMAVWRQSVPRTRLWETQTVPIPVTNKGFYLVEAVHGEFRAYTILFVTDLGIVTKTSPGHVLAYVANRRSGVPIENSTVLVWCNKKEVVRLRTDGQGLAETRLGDARPENVLILAQQGEDFAVNSLYSWYLSSDPDRYWVGYIYTERPVYRPGHTVYFKGILRTQLGAEYRLPDRRQVEVEIRDPESKPVYRKTLAVSPAGTIQGELVLPVTAGLGYYFIQVHAGEAQVQGGFHVEEYKKPEFEVKLLPTKKRVLQGEPIEATIEARYYFGEPVAGGKVTYVVHRSRFWFPLYAEEEEFGEEEEGDYYYGGEQILQETGQLDAEGRLAVKIPTSISDRKWDMRYRIEARVTDQSNREISGFGYVLAIYGSFLVNIQPERYVYTTGDVARFNVEARDYDGNPVETHLRVELFRWRWRESEGPALARVEAQTDSQGKATVALPITEAGSFFARVMARTPEGRELEDRAYIWVTGALPAWYETRRERLQIVPDKKSYRPGEVAKILIVTSAPGAHILLTTEGRAILTRQVVVASAATVTVEVPIRPEYAPNFYVSAAFLRESQLYEGSKSIKVPPLERQLTVELESSKSEYKPGEPAVISVTARDHTGKPVSADFSLGVVDEAIYAIRPEVGQDIIKFFYGQTYNRVHTSSSLSYYFQGEAGKRAMQLAEGIGGGSFRVGRPYADLAQLKPERLVEPRVRKAFPDTIFWVADLKTDANGRAEARFTFPDALTTWRATARGVTRDTKVGSAIHRTVVRKNLMLRLAVPRFFTQGDEVTVSNVVHNYLPDEKTARISFAAEGLDVIEGTTRDVKIPTRGETRLDWRVRARPGREAKLLGKALTDEESDAMELTLPVIPYGVKLATSRAGSLTEPTAQIESELVFPQAIDPTSRALELSVTPSLAGTIFGALEYLTSYPYGCTEQTMSSFLPNIVVGQALRELGLKLNVDQAELQKKIRDGLDRLYDYQHEDGGWGWWQTDESQAFMTAYVLSGLVQAQLAGYPVRERVIEQARNWLRAAFDREKRALPDLRAYLAYALVQGGLRERAVLDAVWQRRSDLTPYGRALLGLAMDLAGDPRAGELAAQLEREAKVDEREAYWAVERDTLMDFYGDASPEATAHAMKLLTRLRPKSLLLPKAAAWLVNHRNEGFYWYSTKQTAMVVYGLTEYLKASGELRPNFTVTVWVNDKQVLSRRFTEADARAVSAPTVRLPAEQLVVAGNKVRITKSGEGRLYWSARAEYYSTEEKLEQKGKVALNLLREYFRLVPEREGERIVYRLEPLEGTLKPGDVLVVRLTVSGGTWRYLMVEDPIPAGTEFIERDDLYEIKDKPSWWYYWFTRREFHDDRAAFFQTYFDRGQVQYLYLLKVVNPGRFRVSPARVQPMYQPQHLATTESKTVEVK